MITLTEKQAEMLYKKLRVAWWNDECDAALDDAMRSLEEQLTASRASSHVETSGNG